MLAFIFFVLIFSSCLWLFFSVSFIADSLAGISFFDAGIANIMLYTLLVCSPVFLLWAVFGYVNQYVQNQQVNKQLQKLLGQMKKNQDYSDLIARVLIEAKQNVNDGFLLARLDLLISELNELLSEIIKGCKLVSSDQIETLWAKVQNGGKWSFGKVIIENNNSQPDFKRRVLEYCVHDTILGGTIMEFCARYNSILKLLETRDKDKLFLDIIETGIMGKVYSILSPVSSEIHRMRDQFSDSFQESVSLNIAMPEIHPLRPSEGEDKEVKKNAFGVLDKLSFFKKKNSEPEPKIERDPFSIALEKSFGDEDEKKEVDFIVEDQQELKEPIFSSPEQNIPESEITDTQKMLDSLKKEWSDNVKKVSEQKAADLQDEADMVYPFGNWTDEESYHK